MSPERIRRIRKLSLAKQRKRLKELRKLAGHASPDQLEERVWLEVELRLRSRDVGKAA